MVELSSRLVSRVRWKLVSAACVVMGVHGAGLSNIIAGRDGLKFMELLNPAWFNPCFVQLASQLGFAHHCAMLKKVNGVAYADIAEMEGLMSSATERKEAMRV